MALQPPTLANTVTSLRIVLVGLLTGVLSLAGIALVLVATSGPLAPNDPPIVTYVLVAMAGVVASTLLVVPTQLAKAAGRADREKGDAFWLGVYRSQRIVAAGIVEGGAFMAVLAYLMEGKAIAMFVAGALVVLLAYPWPSADSITRWIEAQKQRAANG